MQKMQPKPTAQSLRPVIEDKCVTAFLILLILVSAFLLQTGTAFASGTTAASGPSTVCSHPKPNGHCYATVDWNGDTAGAFTNLSPYGDMFCGACDGFIDNEMWLSDTTSAQCALDASGGCWVEAGIVATSLTPPYGCASTNNVTCLFWADARPNPGGFHFHELYLVGADGEDLNPWYFFVKIWNSTSNSASGNTWSVDVQPYFSSNFMGDYTGQSTYNSMTAQDIIIGSELDATPGYAGANEMDFQYNQWKDSGGTWHEQTASAAYNGTDSPPIGYWTTDPNSTNGGIWSTNCCILG